MSAAAPIDDGIRPPLPGDPARAGYKEWLHLNVAGERGEWLALFNASLHGDPDDPRSTAVGAALLYEPGRGWQGNVEPRSLSEARIGPSSIALPEVALLVERGSARVFASAVMERHRFTAEVEAAAESRGWAFPAPSPFGSGWISWYVLPRLRAAGRIVADGRELRFRAAPAYHDHNWGRWHWGDDARWEWCVCFGGASTFVFSRATTRAHVPLTPPLVIADTPRGRSVFAGASVTIDHEGLLDVRLRRFPGALAALHQDRARPHLPRRIRIHAGDGVDALELALDVESAAQLITGDPAVAGYGFIHELAATFTASGTLGGETVAAHGVAAYEYLL